MGEEIQLVKAERKETKRLKSLSIWHRLLRAMKDALSHLPRQARDAHHDKQAEEKAFLLILFSRRDLVVRVPLMIHVPWLPESFGKRTAALVELVDLFPTVASIGGLPSPSSVDGVDVSSLLLAPDPPALTASEADGGVDIVDLGAAYHQYPACGCNENGTTCFNRTRGGCNSTPRQNFGFMGAPATRLNRVIASRARAGSIAIAY